MNTNENETSQNTESTTLEIREDMSFSDYEKVRKGIPIESNKSEPDHKKDQEQKSKSKSEIDKTDESEESEESGDELEAKSDDSENEKTKRKGGFQKRIDKLNARYLEAQREIEHLKSLVTKTPETQKQAESESKKLEGKPDPENFESYSEYVDALTDWKLEVKEKAAKEKEAQTLAQQTQEKLLQDHYKREKEFSEKTDDYADVLEEANYLKDASIAIQDIILNSENGPALMYELAKNKSDYERINRLNPILAAKELGKLEAKLSLSSKESEPKKETKKITNAPAPISTVGKNSTGSVKKSIDDPEISFAEYERLRREQKRRA